MNENQIISVGIDVGTSTTSMVVSRMTVKNIAACFAVPHVDITEKKVVYRSPIYTTPLQNGENLDSDALRHIVETEYRRAGLTPDKVDTGAVIITGESSRKENAALVTETLSGIAGEFVVATAGPDMESVIAGKGAGAQQLSDERSCAVANLDIGGGTTNIAVFCCGELVTTGCLDIGGRLLRLNDKRITYLSPRLGPIIKELQSELQPGQCPTLTQMRQMTNRMARVLAEAIGLCPQSALYQKLCTDSATSLQVTTPIDLITFSGGVADAYYTPPSGLFDYGDIGPLLAQSLHEDTCFAQASIVHPRETMCATVIGAGIYTTTISGSTIDYSETAIFPMKNLPIVQLSAVVEEETRRGVSTALTELLHWTKKQSDTDRMVICFNHTEAPSYAQVAKMATAILAAHSVILSGSPVLVLTRADFAKALGQALKRRVVSGSQVLCIDSIWVGEGDYLDIGKPIANGMAIPVVVKTLIFG